MFEKTSRLAESVANSVSRRGLLGSLGGWAATAALGVAGVLTGGTAHADALGKCCTYASCVSSTSPNIWLSDPQAACPTTNCANCTLISFEHVGRHRCCFFRGCC
jgi:hypothetical protein